MEEIWLPIVGYEGLYEVSNMGRVKSLGNDRDRKEKILKPGNNGHGYLLVRLCKNRKGKWFLVHRLVAEAFIPNPDNLPCINHKDECKTNNQVSNLEWCTHKYNVHYSKSLDKANEARIKSILQFTKDGEFVAEYPSLSEASRQTGFNKGNILNCCKGRYSHSAGYVWRYKKV